MKGHILKTVTEIKDLVVLLDSRLIFINHICLTDNKAKRMLGLLIRNTTNFKNVDTVLILYYALIHSHLEFESIVWNLSTALAIKMIEKV